MNGTNFITNFVENSFFNPVQEGSNGIWFDDNGSSVGQFVFNSAINALGIYVSTDSSETVTASFGGESASFATNTTPAFFGVIADSLFTTIDFEATSGPNIGFDAVSYGTAAVPLPATGLLLLAGLGGLASRRKGA